MLDINAIITRIKKGSGTVHDPHIMHATRDWGIAIVLFSIVSLGGGTYLYFLHTSYQATTLDALSSEVMPVPYQADVVERALRVVADKQAVFSAVSIPVSAVSPGAIESEENNEVELGDSSVELNNDVQDILLESNLFEEPVSQIF